MWYLMVFFVLRPCVFVVSSIWRTFFVCGIVIIALPAGAEVNTITAKEDGELILIDNYHQQASALPSFVIRGKVYQADNLPDRYHAVTFSSGRDAGYKGLRIFPVKMIDNGMEAMFLQVIDDEHSSFSSASKLAVTREPQQNNNTEAAPSWEWSSLLSYLRASPGVVINTEDLPDSFSALTVDDVLYVNASVDLSVLYGRKNPSGASKKRLVIIDDSEGEIVLTRPYKAPANTEVFFIGLHDHEKVAVNVTLPLQHFPASIAIDCSGAQCHFYNVTLLLKGHDQVATSQVATSQVATPSEPLLKNISDEGLHYNVRHVKDMMQNASEDQGMTVFVNKTLYTPSLKRAVNALTRDISEVQSSSTYGCLGYSPSLNGAKCINGAKLLFFASLFAKAGAFENATNAAVATSVCTAAEMATAAKLAVVAAASMFYMAYIGVDFAFYSLGYKKYSLWGRLEQLYFYFSERQANKNRNAHRQQTGTLRQVRTIASPGKNEFEKRDKRMFKETTL